MRYLKVLTFACFDEVGIFLIFSGFVFAYFLLCYLPRSHWRKTKNYFSILRFSTLCVCDKIKIKNNFAFVFELPTTDYLLS